MSEGRAAPVAAPGAAGELNEMRNPPCRQGHCMHSCPGTSSGPNPVFLRTPTKPLSPTHQVVKFS